MAYQTATTRDRVKSAGAAAAVIALIGYGLVTGLGTTLTRALSDDLKVVALLPEAPLPGPKPIPARKQAAKRRQGAASPPNLKSRATEIVAPPSPIAPRQPDPVVVAPIAGPGSDRSAGAAPVIGPGTGSGGQGDGPGSGDRGDGDGGGGDGSGGGATDAELISNKLRYRDLPRDVWDAQAAGTVTYRATIGVDGRLSDCRIAHSSGNAALDAATCALALRNVRFRPARDAAGRKVPDRALFEQEWTVRRDGADREER